MRFIILIQLDVERIYGQSFPTATKIHLTPIINAKLHMHFSQNERCSENDRLCKFLGFILEKESRFFKIMTDIFDGIIFGAHEWE